MKTVHKYEIQPGRSNVIAMDPDAKLLHVAEQNGNLCVWALVDPDAPLAHRSLTVVGTGWDMKSVGEYVGTAQAGPYVWHVFDTTMGAGK